jgi:hypothetical protein
MNPWALILLLLAIAFFIVAYKGTQDNVIAAVKGKPYGNSNIEGSQQKPSGASAPGTDWWDLLGGAGQLL